MNTWLRLYTSVLDDPKVQRLPGDQFKGWVNLLALTKENDGLLPSVEDIAFRLRMSDGEAEGLIETLVSRGLLETDGERLTPHNWNGRQYKSDVSTERVQRFRETKRNVSETPQIQSQIQNTESEEETEPEPCGAIAPVVCASFASSASADVAAVFAYWQTAMNHPQAKLTPKRRKLIAARLKDYTLIEIQRAIDGCRASPFHMGQNETGTVYDDIELICRNGEKLESFISRSNGNGRTQVPRNETHNERAAREYEELIRYSLAANATGDSDIGAYPENTGAPGFAIDIGGH